MNILSAKNIKLLLSASMGLVLAIVTFLSFMQYGIPEAILITWVAALIGFGTTLWVISMFTE